VKIAVVAALGNSVADAMTQAAQAVVDDMGVRFRADPLQEAFQILHTSFWSKELTDQAEIQSRLEDFDEKLLVLVDAYSQTSRTPPGGGSAISVPSLLDAAGLQLEVDDLVTILMAR
jgi:hypothetical protein